jgi:ubiquitin-conjugating enzyme E2 variant
MVEATPHFMQSTRADRTEMRIIVGTNVAIASYCAIVTLSEIRSAGLGWMLVPLCFVAGYFLADFLSGVVHWGVDTWFNEISLGRTIAIAREHHTHPQAILGYNFLEHAALGSMIGMTAIGPLALLTAALPPSKLTFCLMIVWGTTTTFMVFGTTFHNLSHKPCPPKLVSTLQRVGLMLSPQHHWVHHRNQTIRYCTINGWANPLCDALDVWRRLERLVHAVTGAVPRQNDQEWQRIFSETGVLTPPSHSPASAACPKHRPNRPQRGRAHET